MTALIGAAELRETYADHVVLDVQFTLGGPPSGDEYRTAHLPGARHLAVDGDLSAAPGEHGRHPLPPAEAVTAALERCGVRDGDDVVVYDRRTSLSAARAWWVLRYFGFDAVRVLDGGMDAWVELGGPVTTEVPGTAPGSVRLTPGHLPLLDAAGAAAAAAAGRLWDVRTPQRYRGEAEPVDTVAGHIPGARNAPAGDFQDPSGRFLPADRIRRHAAALGLSAGDATSCGSGITAAQVALALAEAGIPVGVYVGSWSEWIADPTRPVATGDDGTDGAIRHL
ncbi:sulfurtransferase [Propionicicella superfundia]|uniref:sulfurtransferase n=1 Tax=Propionicicella superfundia TaxID=348582 RepID=UPI00041FA54B|nr:sulfurtransferase [Propionicicella superfundia]